MTKFLQPDFFMRSARSPLSIRPTLMALASLILVVAVSAQEEDEKPTPPADKPAPAAETPQGRPLKLDISRRSLKNFITDEAALIPYEDKEGAIRELQDVFMIGSVKSSHAAFWDPRSCRLLGALNLKKPAEQTTPSEKEDAVEAASPYTLLAAGKHPLNGSEGTFEKPQYFGFRLIGGQPEFLYTFGRLQIEERVWLEDEGLVLKARFVVKGAKSGYTLTFPAEWRERCEASAGEWKENQLTVPGDAAGELILTFRLDELEITSPPEN